MMQTLKPLGWVLVVLLGPYAGWATGQAAETRVSKEAPAAARSIRLPGLHNTFAVADGIYSGSQPETEAAYVALAALGIKTIISVDGSKPDIESARKHGLEYVHLPVGYDGISTQRVAQLARVPALRPGPYYVHCHHGMHRGPAAVAILCESSQHWSTSQAVAWMQQAGTSSNYPGLYRAAVDFKAPSQVELVAVRTLPERADTSSLVDAMVAIDSHYSALKRIQQNGWTSPPEHPDIVPKVEATLLLEQFRELRRLHPPNRNAESFQELSQASEQAVSRLRDLLVQSGNSSTLDAALQQTTQTCAACHKKYRD